MSGERLTVTLPAADATLETEGAVETGCPQRLYGTVTHFFRFFQLPLWYA